MSKIFCNICTFYLSDRETQDFNRTEVAMDEGLAFTLIFISIFILIAYIFKYVLDYRLRLRLIEKDLVDEKVKHLFVSPPQSHGLAALKWALLLVGLGIGVYTGTIIGYGRREDFQIAMTFSFMFIFAGGGLVVYYIIASIFGRNKQNNE